MATSITTITNMSKQVVPILLNSIAKNKASKSSGIPPDRAQQMQIAPGAQFSVETQRIDQAQLQQLGRKRLLRSTIPRQM